MRGFQRHPGKLSGFIHLWNYFIRVVSKSGFGSASTEMCLPISSAQWLVTAGDVHFKYVCAALHILAQSQTVRLLDTQLSALGETQKVFLPSKGKCCYTKFRNLLEKVLLMYIHTLLTSLSSSVPSSSHIQSHRRSCCHRWVPSRRPFFSLLPPASPLLKTVSLSDPRFQTFYLSKQPLHIFPHHHSHSPKTTVCFLLSFRERENNDYDRFPTPIWKVNSSLFAFVKLLYKK